MKKKEQNEIGRQFDEIIAEYNDPQKREEKKILNNRKKRAENIKKDLGM
jgi:hypothetical protein